MPVVVIALYAVVYVTGAWTFGQAQGFAPAASLAQAVLFVICIAWYGRAGLGPSLIGGAVLLAFTLALALATGLVIAAVFGNLDVSARAGLALLIGLVSSVLYVAVIMAISARLCPALRQVHFWIIALFAYPLFSLVVNATVPLFLTLQSPRTNAVTAALFAAFVVRQLALFTCLGAWVARPAPDVPSVFS